MNGTSSKKIKQTPVGVYYPNKMYSTYNSFGSIPCVTSATDGPCREIENIRVT